MNMLDWDSWWLRINTKIVDAILCSVEEVFSDLGYSAGDFTEEYVSGDHPDIVAAEILQDWRLLQLQEEE